MMVFNNGFKYNRSYHKEHVASTEIDTSLLGRLLKYLKPYRWLLILSISLLIISRAIEAMVPIFIGNIVQQVFDTVLPSTDESKNSLVTHISYACLGIFLLLVLVYLLDGINLLIRNWVGQKALFTLRKQVFEHIQNLPLSTFDRNPVGRLMTRTIHDVDQVDQMFSESVVPILGNLMLFVGVILGVLWVNWKVGLLACTIIPFVWWLARHFRTRQRKCYEMVRSIVSAMNSFLQEHMMGSSIIRHFGLQKREYHIFTEINQDYRTAQVEAMHNFSFFYASIDFLQNFILILVFTLLMTLGTGKEGFQAGTYFTFSLYALMIFRPIADLAERYNVLQSAIAASRRIFDILDQKTEIESLQIHEHD